MIVLGLTGPMLQPVLAVRWLRWIRVLAHPLVSFGLWAALLMAPFALTDGVYLLAALTKLGEGAWLPVAFGALMVLVMLTWRRGTGILVQKTRRTEVPLESLVNNLEKRPPHIVKGTAVFLTSDPSFVPTALMHNLKHNKVLHERIVILTVLTLETPYVDEPDRVEVENVVYTHSIALVMIAPGMRSTCVPHRS